MIDSLHPYGQQQECVGDVRLSFFVESGFQVADTWAGEELSLFTADLNDRGSGREICIFLQDNYIVDYSICANVTLYRSLLQLACVFCSTAGSHSFE